MTKYGTFYKCRWVQLSHNRFIRFVFHLFRQFILFQAFSIRHCFGIILKCKCGMRLHKECLVCFRLWLPSNCTFQTFKSNDSTDVECVFFTLWSCTLNIKCYFSPFIHKFSSVSSSIEYCLYMNHRTFHLHSKRLNHFRMKMKRIFFSEFSMLWVVCRMNRLLMTQNVEYSFLEYFQVNCL